MFEDERIAHNERIREWRKKNPEKARALGRKHRAEYRAKYPERIRAQEAARRAKKKAESMMVCPHCGVPILKQ